MGEFEHQGRSRVVYPEALILAMRPIRIRMSRELIDAAPFHSGRVAVLECCWIPCDLARQWLIGKRVPLPPWLHEGHATRAIEPGNAPAPLASLPVHGQRRHNGHDYRCEDDVLVTEMWSHISQGDARSAQAAARIVVTRATGHGTDDSKVKRLTKRYRKQYT